MVIHPGGVTLASQLGETTGIIAAPGAKGARVASGSGARIDGAGYAIVPNLMPYRINTVAIDPEGSAPDVELKATSQEIAPRANSVVMLKFGTAGGRGVMLGARLPDGQPVPFGSSVYDAGHTEIGIADQYGQIFLRGIPDTGTLQIEWGDLPQSACLLDYRLPQPSRGDLAMLKVEASCIPRAVDAIAAAVAPHIDYLPL